MFENERSTWKENQERGAWGDEEPQSTKEVIKSAVASVVFLLVLVGICYALGFTQ